MRSKAILIIYKHSHLRSKIGCNRMPETNSTFKVMKQLKAPLRTLMCIRVVRLLMGPTTSPVLYQCICYSSLFSLVKRTILQGTAVISFHSCYTVTGLETGLNWILRSKIRRVRPIGLALPGACPLARGDARSTRWLPLEMHSPFRR